MKIIQNVKIIGTITTNESMRQVEFHNLMTKDKLFRDGCVELEHFPINGRKYRYDTDYRNPLWGSGQSDNLEAVEQALKGSMLYFEHVKEIMKQFRELERKINNGKEKSTD